VTPELQDLAREMARLSALLDRAIATLRTASLAHADEEHTYRKARGEAWVRSAGKGQVVPEREAQVDAVTADVRLARDRAAALEKSALEAVRARRTQLSALQSLMGAHREEAAFARTGPESHP
jgi:hypothetical protein